MPRSPTTENTTAIPSDGNQEQNTKFGVLKAAIREGLESGDSDTTIDQLMAEVEARLRADGRL